MKNDEGGRLQPSRRCYPPQGLRSEWVDEELGKLEQEKPIANMRETKRFYGALLVSILAAIATLVAVWPVITGYFK